MEFARKNGPVAGPVDDSRAGDAGRWPLRPARAYLAAMVRDTAEYASPAFLVAVALATLYLLFNSKSAQVNFFLIFWLAVSTLLTFCVATLVAPRYILPAAAPLILILAIAVTDVWQRSTSLAIRAGMVAAAGAWLIR